MESNSKYKINDMVKFIDDGNLCVGKIYKIVYLKYSHRYFYHIENNHSTYYTHEDNIIKSLNHVSIYT